MAGAATAVEELIREYLLYRGFVQTLRTFEQERKEDKDKGLKVNRIVDHILVCVNKSDFVALESFLNHLNHRFFSRLGHDLMNNYYKIESSILRLYLVNAHRGGRHEDIKLFFEKMAVVLQERRDWKEWFAFPFTKNPDQHPSFKLYFTREWYDAFCISLFNFFSIMFAGLPLPALLQFETEHQRIQSLETQNALMYNQLATTKENLHETETNCQRLEAKLAGLVAQQTAAINIKRAHSVGQTVKATAVRSPHRKTFSQPASSPSSVVRTSKSNHSPLKSQNSSANDKNEQESKEVETSLIDPPTIQESTLSPSGEEVLKKREEESEGFTQEPPEYDSDILVPNGGEDGDQLFGAELFASQPFLVVDEQVYKAHVTPITHCEFSPNATYIASADISGALRVWEATSTSGIITKAMSTYKNNLLSMNWVHHGSSDMLLMIGTGNAEVKLFDVASSSDLWEFTITERRFPRVLSLVCSPSNYCFAMSTAATHHLHHHLSSSVRSATSSLTDPMLPSQLNRPAEMVNISRNSSGNITHEPVSGQLLLGDLNQQKIVRSLNQNPEIATNCMAFNHNGNLLVAGGVDGMIKMYDVGQAECICLWNAHNGGVYNIQFSSDENTVYSMGQDGKFCQWSTLRTTQKVADFPIHPEATFPAASWMKASQSSFFPATPRGNLFAFESDDKFVLTCSPSEGIIYEVNSDNTLTRVLGLSDRSVPVTCVDWVPGRRSYSTCVMGLVDSSVKVVNLLKCRDTR